MSNEPSIKDYEDALRAVVDQLYMMYDNNGGEAAQRTVMQLLMNVDRLSPWLEDVVKQYPGLQPILDKVKGNGVGNG